jgi:hypothetical protein
MPVQKRQVMLSAFALQMDDSLLLDHERSL